LTALDIYSRDCITTGNQKRSTHKHAILNTRGNNGTCLTYLRIVTWASLVWVH